MRCLVSLLWTHSSTIFSSSLFISLTIILFSVFCSVYYAFFFLLYCDFLCYLWDVCTVSGLGKFICFDFNLIFYCFSPKYLPLFCFCLMIRKFVVRLLKYPVQKGETMNLFRDFKTIFTSSSSHHFIVLFSSSIWNSRRQCVKIISPNALSLVDIKWKDCCSREFSVFCVLMIFEFEGGNEERYKRVKVVEAVISTLINYWFSYSNWFHHHIPSSSLYSITLIWSK